MVALHATKLPPQQIGRVISVVADALVRRMIELAIESKGTAPAEFAFLALGSHGGREPVPSSDVDSGMAWEDESESSDGVVGYMGRSPPTWRTASGSLAGASIHTA